MIEGNPFGPSGAHSNRSPRRKKPVKPTGNPFANEVEHARKVAHARSTDPSTSQIAALKVSSNLSENQQSVLEAFIEGGAMTDVELVRFYQSNTGSFFWPLQSESGLRTRRKELTDVGLIVNTLRKIRVDGHGLSIVWDLAPDQRAKLANG